MKKNTRSQLFFLKQFGFSGKLLDIIYRSDLNPLDVVFNHRGENFNSMSTFFSPKDKKLSFLTHDFNRFVSNLVQNEDLLKSKSGNKIFFKYDVNEITNILPESILPLFMYGKGDLSLLAADRSRVSIIGTRTPSEKSIEMTRYFTKKFVSEKYIVVSGLADGIDSISHRTVLENGGKTIAVLPTNFNKIYPKRNEKLANEISTKGLLLTSIGPNENTYKKSFLERNKYVANICDLLLIVETNLKSGTMNTIRNAGEAQKKILFIDQKDSEINKKIIEFGGEMIDIKNE